MLRRQCGSRSRHACSGSYKAWGPRAAAPPQHHLCLVVQASWGLVRAAAAVLLGPQAGQQVGGAQRSCSTEQGHQGSCTTRCRTSVCGFTEVTAVTALEPENGLFVEAAVTGSGTASCFLGVNDFLGA